jgi:pSer/pThr/pTyr-binding forkhead associated (FHA) protein
MKVRCPGCKTSLNVDDEAYEEKVLLQCPDCLFVFLARPAEDTDEDAEAPGEATLLTSDVVPDSDAREFQWNVPGASLTIIEGDSQGIHKKLKEQKLVIGRKGADLALMDQAVSRRHCEIEKRGDAWFVKDLASKNGTLVNGKKVKDQRLHHLDEIKVGNARLLFAESEAQAERAPEEVEGSLDVTKVDDKSKERELKLPRGREFFLEYMTGPKKGRSIKFVKARVIIGRGEEADVDLDDQGVSRKHAVIEVQSREQAYISDLASQNGTWLNGMRIKMTRLIHGDKLRLGNTVLKFIAQDLL